MVKKTAKKTAKKATRKTAAKRKTTSRKAAKKTSTKSKASKTTKAVRHSDPHKAKVEVYQLADAPEKEKYFILANGKPVKHVKQLAEIMDHLEDHVFDHHVNPERNDFGQWVHDVFQDVELAKKMLGVSNKKDLQLVIYKHAAHKAFKR